MAHEFDSSAVIDRPIAEVFAFLGDGMNDPKFSPRVREMQQTTPGPVGVGTVFASTVKDAGMTTHRKFELTTFDAPTKIRWPSVRRTSSWFLRADTTFKLWAMTRRR